MTSFSCPHTREQTGHNTRDCPFRKSPGGAGDKAKGGGGGGVLRQRLLMEGGIGRVDMAAVVERRVREEHWHVDSGKPLRGVGSGCSGAGVARSTVCQ